MSGLHKSVHQLLLIRHKSHYDFIVSAAYGIPSVSFAHNSSGLRRNRLQILRRKTRSNIHFAHSPCLLNMTKIVATSYYTGLSGVVRLHSYRRLIVFPLQRWQRIFEVLILLYVSQILLTNNVETTLYLIKSLYTS